MNKKATTKWSVPVPCILDHVVEVAVRHGTYSTKSELIRDAVKRRLEQMGYKTHISQSEPAEEEA